MPKLRNPDTKYTPALPDSLGKRIAACRKQLGLTQAQLSRAIGVSRNMIADYENNRIRIYDEMVARLAIALKVTTDTLLGLDEHSLLKEDPISLRFIKRVKAIQKLPESEQKAIIKFIDIALKSSIVNPNR